jgi:hypothetical protein
MSSAEKPAVLGLVTAVLVVVMVLFAFASMRIGPGPQGETLLNQQASGVQSTFASPFVVPWSPQSQGLVNIVITVFVNVSCGSPPPGWHASYNCTFALITGSFGEATPEILLWQYSFTGYTDSISTELLPGNYSVLVHVVVGSPPGLVLIVTFSVALVVETVV